MDIVLAIIGSSAFTALINAIIELIKNRTGQKKVSDKGIMFSLLYCLQAYGDKLTAKNYISIEDYKQFEEMYTTYKELKGNGYAERIKAEIDKIPIYNERRNQDD